MLRALLIVSLVGCFDSSELDIELLRPDAAQGSTPDACVQEPSRGCCDLLPDANAVIACSSQGMDPGGCGVAVCHASDCSRIALSFCVPD